MDLIKKINDSLNKDNKINDSFKNSIKEVSLNFSTKIYKFIIINLYKIIKIEIVKYFKRFFHKTINK